MGTSTSPLTAAIGNTHQTQRPAQIGMKVGLGWFIFSFLGQQGTVWHDDGTGGFRSYTGFNPDAKRGVVVLANSANDIDDLGQLLVGDRESLEPFELPHQRAQALIDFAVYEKYVGKYTFEKGGFITVTCNESHLFAQESGEGESRREFFPESKTDFFSTAVDAQLTFIVG